VWSLEPRLNRTSRSRVVESDTRDDRRRYFGIGSGESRTPKVSTAPRFQVGQLVRARNVHPRHHTRLPRCARGKQGVVARHNGIFVFPDTNAHFAGENPQHLYSVSFAARELWGPQASPRDAVHLDMWDDYLDLA
jgi:hypothetical protein